MHEIRLKRTVQLTTTEVPVKNI